MKRVIKLLVGLIFIIFPFIILARVGGSTWLQIGEVALAIIAGMILAAVVIYGAILVINAVTGE